MQSQAMTPFFADGVEHLVGQLTLTATESQGTPTSQEDFQQSSFVINRSIIDPNGTGQVGELIFRLTIPETASAWQSGMARVWIDNVRFGSLGLPIQTEQSGAGTENSNTTLDLTMLTPLIEASRLGWQHVIEAPDWLAGGAFGQVGISTEGWQGEWAQVHEDWATRSRESGLNGQVDLVSSGSSFAIPDGHDQPAVFIRHSPLVEGLADGTAVTDQVGRDANPACATHRHAVQSQGDALLLQRQQTALLPAITDEGLSDHAPVGDDRAFIREGAIGIANGNLSSHPASGGGNGACSNLQILQLQQFMLQPFVMLNSIGCEGGGLEGPNVVGATRLYETEQEQGQSVVAHNAPFGSPTLPPDRSLVNQTDALGNSFIGLTAEQLALLNQATVTIADLADGYLALTNGTTITLDADAAGYGWFIDSTPLLNEEFTLSAVSHQLSADPNGLAAGRMDLLTVLMHELGHVMGLGHVSSAVDGTRLMAGSIDPGVRRLPSALDLGPESSSVNGHASSELDTDSHIWDPYLAHYTPVDTIDDWRLTNDAASGLPAVNPASLVQAAQLPSHSGIFNPNFAVTDTTNAQYGWEASGAVTIANGQAVLSEASNVISTLSQTFTLPAGSTHLRFTLVDVNLQSNGTNRPQDAFEVAFLEASTLAPLAGVTAGLTQTDSLFNLQQDGTVRFSNKVTLSNGVTSGSTLDLTQPVIVDIDLTGIAVGAGAYLSFDLLGFGDRTSTIVLDNVLLTNGQPTAAPVAVNDSYTVAEGGSVLSTPLSGLLSNDTDADTALADLSALLVAGPQYGTLSLNADGSFSYVHNGSETNADSFTYRVSDGINLSNSATVSFTITPTNDAPVINTIAPQTVEQGRTLSVTVVATDPDDSNIAPESNTLTYSLGTGAPAGASIDLTTGVFTWSVPRTQAVGSYQITVNVTDAGTPALSATRTFTVDVIELTNTPPTLDPIGNKTVNEESERGWIIGLVADAD